jgi:hypothetical protein
MADISYARPIEFVRACDDYSSAQVTSVSGSVNPLDVHTKSPLTTKQALSDALSLLGKHTNVK